MAGNEVSVGAPVRPARPPEGPDAPPRGGEPAPSERLRAREWLANAVRPAGRIAGNEVRVGALVRPARPPEGPDAPPRGAANEVSV
ncbi:MAG: hypothetical protein RIS35_3529, partial [Pseudomonadota bacterium]